MSGRRRTWYARRGKRAFDLVISIPLSILATPVMLLLAIIIRVRLGGPVLFQQQRPGLHGKPFVLLKFRTMNDRRDRDGNPLSDAERLTPFGIALRKASLDELPELVNVLKGEMSLVGPRPLLTEYLEHYSREQACRHDVVPGITGWAQVNGRNELTWEEKFKLDVWYAENVSLRLDLKVLALTLWKILKREGISHPGEATMSKFKGTVIDRG